MDLIQQKDIIENLNTDKLSKETLIQELTEELNETKIYLSKEKDEKELIVSSNEKYISEIDELKIVENENSQKSIDLESELNNQLSSLKDDLFNSNNIIENLKIEVYFFPIIIIKCCIIIINLYISNYIL